MNPNDPNVALPEVAQRFATLLVTNAFVEALTGHLPGDAASQKRLPDLMEKLRLIAALTVQ